MKRRGLLIILSSPSGAGKSTLSRRLMAWDPTLRFSVSATTRPPREGEVDGEHYYFVSKAEFQRMVENGEMLESEGLVDLIGKCNSNQTGQEFLDDLYWNLTQVMSPEFGLEDDVSATLFEYEGP